MLTMYARRLLLPEHSFFLFGPRSAAMFMMGALLRFA